MPEDVKRMRYFNGLFLKESEFNLEQDYHLRMRRLHNRHMHTHGIASGLEVEVGAGTAEIIIKAGMALDLYSHAEYGDISREIILGEDTSYFLTDFFANDKVYVWVYYDESQADVVAEQGGTEALHYWEQARVGMSTTKPDKPGENLILGKVTLNALGGIDPDGVSVLEDDSSPLRISAGFSGKKFGGEIIELIAPEEPENWAYLTGKIYNGTESGIEVNSPHTNVTGDLSVSGNFAGRVPLGGVIAVFDYGENVPGTDVISGDGFMLADGGETPVGTVLRTMADNQGKPTTRPDITNDVFLMGASVSGAAGGANSVTVTIPAHTHDVANLTVIGAQSYPITGTTDNPHDTLPGAGLSQHQHSYSHDTGNGSNFINAGVNYGHLNGTVGPPVSPDDVNHAHNFSTSLDLSSLDVGGSIGAGGQSGDTSMSADAHENRPSYISAIYLIRVN